MKFVKLWFVVVIAIAGVLFFALSQPMVAASPEVTPVAQAGGVELEKKASQDLANLGEIFSYYITIKNSNSDEISFTLEDTLPETVILKTATISVTTGLVDVAEQTINWSGTLAANEVVTITYNAIPPALSAAGETISNVAILNFNGTTLESEAIVTTQEGDYSFFWWFLGPIVNVISFCLIEVDHVLEALNVPYSFGFAIILFTVAIRALTFPLNLQQIKSSKAMQALQPKMKKIQEKYKDDREKLAMEQMALYREHGVNPLGGCLPMLVQMPIWISLYWALIQLAAEERLTEGFLWIPSLAGPVAYEQASIDWLWTYDWMTSLSYLILPVLLVVSQMYMQQMLTPPTTDPQQAQMQQMMKFMPLMFGYFALIVPAGLTLYWFTSNALMLAQQYFTKVHFDTPTLATETATTDPSPSKVVLSQPEPVPSVPVNGNSKEGKKKNARKRKSRNKRKNR